MSVTVYQPSVTTLTGTWTPVIGGSGGTSGQAYTAQVGRYTRIGNLVVAAFYVELSTEGTVTGDAQIQGLPFTSAATGQAIFTHAVMWNSLATTWVSVFARINDSTTAATLRGAQSASSGNTSALTAADLDNNSRFIGTLIYETA
jgi:hypothetical protein